MINVNDKGFKYYSMPIHNPYYEQASELSFSADIFTVDYKAERPDVIAGIVPTPLAYKSEDVKITLNVVKELKSGFPDGFALWNEMSIQIPVIYKDYPCDYICEIYCSHLKSIIFDREVLGLPRVPGHVSVARNEHGLMAKLTDLFDEKELIGLNFELSGAPPERPRGPQPKKVFFKYIPSPDLSNTADVKKLVEMKYGRPLVHEIMRGKGSIKFLEKAPDYLRDAGIAEVNEAVYLDMDLHVLGATVLHKYM
jgi:acetoacetate decarboxylase